jgi:hypothetical protein
MSRMCRTNMMELISSICFRWTLVNTVRYCQVSGSIEVVFGLDIGFTDHFNIQLVITLNYSAIADLHTLQITVTHTSVLSLLPHVSWQRLLTVEILQLLRSCLIWMVAPFQLSTLAPTKSSLHRLTDKAQSQSQSYFTTGGLPPVTLSWRQAPWYSQRSFFQMNLCGHSLYVTSSLTRKWVCLLWIGLAFHQVYVSHMSILHVIENSSFCTLYKSSVSTGLA